MSRPGAWGRVMTNLWKYLRKDWSTKHYIGEDALGHRYYEVRNTRQNVTRGYDPPPEAPESQPSVEWQSWLKGTRRFPPSEQEIALNRMKQQVVRRCYLVTYFHVKPHAHAYAKLRCEHKQNTIVKDSNVQVW
ncbi:unnamed protein product [Heligmosomoides polygyrus]|uniref:NADH dehydrogenase [ubiquinone] 1 alpha subcomplex subunit n=1 Tax=Heligmosomoides polygyrus TaxID=6339 RepID=A0A183GC18_HELPZ|nr:unnamed protein product [Heligmosomoides polygyrus]